MGNIFDGRVKSQVVSGLIIVYELLRNLCLKPVHPWDLRNVEPRFLFYFVFFLLVLKRDFSIESKSTQGGTYKKHQWWGLGGEMTQALYAYMNNNKKISEVQTQRICYKDLIWNGERKLKTIYRNNSNSHLGH
jgi:hypothetical protein